MEDKNMFNISGVSHIEKDFELVKALMVSQKSSYFGPPPRQIHYAKDFFRGYATHRMIVREFEGAVRCIGYAQFMHYPLIEALPKDSWPVWLYHHFCPPNIAQMTQCNTLFLNRLIYSHEHNPQLLLSVLTELFAREPKVRFIAVVQMPENKSAPDTRDEPKYDCLEPYSKIIYPREFSVRQCNNTQRIFVIYRDTVVEKMRYRRALAEDNDDIVEVIDFDRPDLREEHGDYYIAEELLNDDTNDHNVFIVTEINHLTIGFIWLNDAVDIMMLVRNFHLESFGNLIKHSYNESTMQKRLKVIGMERKPNFKLFTQAAITDILDENFMGRVVPRDKASAYSLYSMGSTMYDGRLRVTSHDGLIHTSNEEFFLREAFLRKVQKLEERLRNGDYYHVRFKKSLRILYNVPDECVTPNESLYPPDANPNVFAVQLFGINIENDVRRLFRFLATAFAAFPDRDYCIIAIPKSAPITRCLYEILKCFMPVVPRPKGVLTDRLYITHRSSIYGEITVHPVRVEDADYVESMLMADKRAINRRASHYSVNAQSSHAIVDVPPEMLAEAEMVREILDDVLYNPDTEFTFMTIRCGNSLRPIDENTIIGYCILRRFTQMHKLWHFFELAKVEAYVSSRTAEVIVLKVHPLYTYHSDLMFREIARISGYWQFYHIVPTYSFRKPFTNDLAGHMEPIEPRYIRLFHRAPQQEDASSGTPSLVPPINFDHSTYAVYYHNLKPSRFFGNKNQLVLYGFSEMSKAFLRLLIFNFNAFGEKYSFNCLPHPNIIVITKPGIVEAEYDSHLLCDTCKVQRACWLNFQNCNNFIRDTIRRVELRKWVNFISGNVVMIDRERKLVKMDNDCEIYYDKLLLARTTDFGVPTGISEYDLPPNYCQVNSRLDKILLFHKIKLLKEEIKDNNEISIIIYGSHLRAYEFIHFLLGHGIEGKFIKMVLPFAPTERDLHVRFNITTADLKVEEILQEMVEDLGVTVHERMTLKHWITYPNEIHMSHAVFETFPDHEEVVLACDLFVSYFERNIENRVLDLYRRSGVHIENNYIMVDENFCTNDPSIYAMGRCAEPTVLPNHQYTFVAPQERAQKILRILKLDLHQRINAEEKFSQPAFFQAQLPMGYYITKVTLPKRYLANHLGNDYGHSLVTYDGNFSRVRLNEHGVIEEIVCVTRKYLNFDHLQSFVGKHESMLNDLHARWYLGEIRSFVDYFQEPWTELIMHSHFNELRERVTSMCQETANDIWKDHPNIDRKQRKEFMKTHLNNVGTTHDIERLLLEYLRKYREDFIHPFLLPEDFQTTH